MIFLVLCMVSAAVLLSLVFCVGIRAYAHHFESQSIHGGCGDCRLQSWGQRQRSAATQILAWTNVGAPVMRKARYARLHVHVHKAHTLTGDRCVCTRMKPQPQQTVRACPPPGHWHVHARPTCSPSHLHRARWHTLVGASIARALASSHGFVHAC